MTKQEFLPELERALGKLPHAEVEQALAFYDEAISDRMEDGLSGDCESTTDSRRPAKSASPNYYPSRRTSCRSMTLQSEVHNDDQAGIPTRTRTGAG